MKLYITSTVPKVEAMPLLVLLLLLLAHTGFAQARADENPSEDLAGGRVPAFAGMNTPEAHLSNLADSFFFSRRLFHRFGLEIRPDYIFQTNPFLRGENASWEPVDNCLSTHLKYSFQFHPNTMGGRIFREAYQGVGLAWYTFGEGEQLGNPLALYLFQGARISRFNRRLSLNYEWNFGLSFGWKPYDYDTNFYNVMIGSKANAYINMDLYLSWMLSPQFDLNGGVTLSHFSNGNTKFPNAGLNTTGLSLGVTYNFNREDFSALDPAYQQRIPEFPRHISYDLVFFGSWRRKGVVFGDKMVASPDAYPVAGFSFAPMYNFGYKLRTGVSVDGVYDGSANVYTEDYIVGTGQEFFKPSLSKQLALGISGRAEYVMPYFTVGVGMGVNVLHRGGDLKAFYQLVALKIELSRRSFIHIGYNLKDFHDPNFLMLGVGFRFNDHSPSIP
ncbi:MAG: acyloxyacyl hydrolase [Prolixibacteraceae bacterium]